MKRKKKKQPVLPAETPAEEAQSFTLEDIIQEFGSGEQAQADPALQTPVPRHMTEDRENLRYRPDMDDLPERQLPSETGSFPPDTPVEAPVEEPAAPDILAASHNTKAPDASDPTAPSPVKALPQEKPRRHKADNASPFPTGGKQPVFHQQPTRPSFPTHQVRQATAEVRQTPSPAKHKPPKPRRTIVTPEAQFRQAQKRQGSRNIRLVLCILFALGNLVLGFFHSQGMLAQYPRQALLVLAQLVLLALCALSAAGVIADGLRQLLRPGFGFNTLVTINVLVSLADGVLAAQAPRCTYCPLVCLLLVCALWGMQLQSKSICAAMDPARRTSGETALVQEPNLFQKTAGVLRGSGSLTEFLQANNTVAGPQKFANGFSLLAAVAAPILAGLTCGGKTDTFLQYWAAMLLAGTPLLGSVTWFRPWAILNRRLQERGASVYGWAGACRLRGKIAVPIGDNDLFPRENLKLNGVKYYGDFHPDRVVGYGYALISATGCSLAPLFQELMEARGGRRYALTQFRRYESGGVGGEIGADSVLAGSLRFMQSMGVDMPAGTRVGQAVYVAINGTLAGVFAIHYGVTRSAAESLGALAASRGVTPVIVAGDFLISESFLRSKFRVNTSRIKIPPLSVRAEMAQRKPSAGAKPCVLLRDGRFSAVALAVAGARALCTAVRWGTLVNGIGSVMGLIIMGVLANLAAGNMMSMVNLGLYLLIWSVPSLLLSGWPRNV